MPALAWPMRDAHRIEDEQRRLYSDKEGDSEDASSTCDNLQQRRRSTFFPPSWSTKPILLYGLVLLLTNLISTYSAYSYAERNLRREVDQDFVGTDKVFPGLDRTLALSTYSNHRVNATSRWTAPPSKEVDHAWNELGVKDMGFLLPGAIGREYGLDPRKHVYAPKGTLSNDTDGFPVFIQALHDVHCLNELRRALYYNKDYYRQFQDDTLTSESFRVSHINHCLDNVRERLMCSADAGIIPSVWTSKDENFPLFGSQHKCHNYEALMEWNRKWHESERERTIDWTVRLSAPEDAIFHDIHDFQL